MGLFTAKGTQWETQIRAESQESYLLRMSPVWETGVKSSSAKCLEFRRDGELFIPKVAGNRWRISSREGVPCDLDVRKIYVSAVWNGSEEWN